MPQTVKDQNERTQEPNWVDVWTLFVLTLTLIAAVVLACFAYQQDTVAQRALELNSRPYIEVTVLPQTFFSQIGDKIRVTILLRNYGGMPANVRVKSIIVPSATKLPAATWAGAKDQDGETLVFPKNLAGYGLFIYSSDPITEGQFQDMRAGTDYIYIRVLAVYGAYRTEICTEYKLIKSQTGSTISGNVTDIHLCSDATTTSVS